MVTTGYDFLVALGEVHVVDLFLLAIVLDLPRYLLGFIAVTATATLFEGQPARAAGPAADVSGDLPVSVLLAGHNEESTIERCVRSLHEQSYAGPMEIICVDDGSTDRTYAIMRQLEREGLVQRAVRLDLRGGKAAAINAAAVLATGRIFLVVDCDCSFDRHAVLEMLRPFREDAGVGAVCGNILVRMALTFAMPPYPGPLP
ncbi:MAG: glycosyltransferase family 2 protein [Xanthobacteraceae bacterium]